MAEQAERRASRAQDARSERRLVEAPLPAAAPRRELMRVLHAPSEIAGQPSILARALRDLGVEAWSLATNPTYAQ